MKEKIEISKREMRLMSDATLSAASEEFFKKLIQTKYSVLLWCKKTEKSA